MLYNSLDERIDEVSEYLKFYEYVKQRYKTRKAISPDLLNDFSIKLNYHIEIIGGVRVFYKKQFPCDFFIVNEFTMPNSNFDLPYDRESFSFYNLYGKIRLNSSWSRTVIRPERLSDKFIELFNQKEVDFESNIKFSKKYYVLSDDEKELRSKVTFEFLDYLESIDGLTLELNKKECVFKLPKTNDFNESLRLLEIGYQLNCLLN